MSLLKCKACGYITSAEPGPEICPACGLPKTALEPYTERVSAGRKQLIDIHMHQIMVHFPTVFGVMATLFLVLSYFVPDPWRAEFLINAKYAILLLPLSAVGAVISGLMDGRLRLKKLSTPVLKRKIAAAILFSLSAIAMTTVWCVAGFSAAGIQIMILLGVLCQLFGIYLGRVGATLLGTSLPG